MKNKATHNGHCQACGRLQKLPKGLLSLHGYNVAHGFFSGTCVGARELPFEQSCELVKGFIASAKTQLEHVKAEQAELRQQPTADTKMWARIRYEGPRGYGATNVWEQVTLEATFRPYGYADDPNAGSMKYRYLDATGREHGSDQRGGGFYGINMWDLKRSDETPDVEACRLATVLKHNETRANWLESEVKSLTRYIAWQTERVENWKPAPLLPVDHKDKEGFVPDAPAY